MNELLYLVDEDTNSFKKIMDAFSLPKGSEAEREARDAAIQDATLYATEIPLRTMQVSYSAFDLVEEMVKEGNPNSVSDAGVGALALRSAIFGAYMNVRINSVDLKNRETASNLVREAQSIFDKSVVREKQITDAVIQTISR